MDLTHLRSDGTAFMVDVTAKEPTVRQATAVGRVDCSPNVLRCLREGTVPKGDVLAVARIAGIQAAKRTPDLLPLAHVVGVHGCEVDVEAKADHVAIRATVRTADRTGVEMEALTAVTVAALAVVDMVKGVDRSAVIREAMIVRKSGGRSGVWVRGGRRRPGRPEAGRRRLTRTARHADAEGGAQGGLSGTTRARAGWAPSVGDTDAGLRCGPHAMRARDARTRPAMRTGPCAKRRGLVRRGAVSSPGPRQP